MAIAGRVAIVPKGEWSQSVTYDKLDLVTHNGNTFIAYKSSVGVEPVDGDTWMLVMQGIDPQDIENIIDGTTPAGDTLKLGGKGASEYVQTDGNVIQKSVGRNNYITYPDGGIISMNGTYTGKLRITLPVTYNGDVLGFNVEISNSAAKTTKGTYYIGANLQRSSSSWKYPTVYSIGDYGSTHINLPVRLGHNATNCVVTIGEDTTVWTYTQVAITDIQTLVGSSYNAYRSGWSIAVSADNSDLTVTATVENPFIGANYLPKTGGEITGSGIVLKLTHSGESFPWLGFGNKNGVLGYFGFNEAHEALAHNGTYSYPILHTGNKPTGTYTGNGSATREPINTGGIGEALLISSTNGFAIITYYGVLTTETISSKAEASFRNGVLTLASTSDVLNKSGATYRYQVL